MLFPEEQATYVLLASVYVQEGLYDEGVSELEPLVKGGNAEASVYNDLGCVLLMPRKRVHPAHLYGK